MSYLNRDGSLGALTLEESIKIRLALMESTSESSKAFGLSLMKLVNWMPFFKGKKDGKQIRNRDRRQNPAIIGSDGYLLPLPEEINLKALIENRLTEQGLLRHSAYWSSVYEKLEEKRHEEQRGDLCLVDENRRKLIAKRLNATPFEQAAQRFSADISSRFCDVNGDIISPESLEEFAKELIDCLLKKTKQYWPRAPLLTVFDAVVVPVLRPMLYPHQTWKSQHNFVSENGAFDVRQLANKRTSLETTPIWNDSAKQQALHFVEEALKHHLSCRFLGLRSFDAFSPYNSEIHSSVHMNTSGCKGKTKSFGPPAHAKDVMQLIQPIAKKPEENLLDKVMTYRSVEEGVWY